VLGVVDGGVVDGAACGTAVLAPVVCVLPPCSGVDFFEQDTVLATSAAPIAITKATRRIPTCTTLLSFDVTKV
jgi:hypothetical protein